MFWGNGYTDYMKKIHRFIGDFDLAKDEIIITDKERVNHMRNVLKLFEGERISLCDGKGNDADAKIGSIEKEKIIIHIVSRFCNLAEPEQEVTLFTAVLKGDNFDFIVQKATEIGVSHIVPIITENTVKQGINKGRLERIALEAAELSGRGMVPTIQNCLEFGEAIGFALAHCELIYFFDTTGTKQNFKVGEKKKIGLFVGPEGGWGDEERIMASDAGCVFASLGPRVMRGETAAIIASYLACLP